MGRRVGRVDVGNQGWSGVGNRHDSRWGAGRGSERKGYASRWTGPIYALTIGPVRVARRSEKGQHGAVNPPVCTGYIPKSIRAHVAMWLALWQASEEARTVRGSVASQHVLQGRRRCIGPLLTSTHLQAAHGSDTLGIISIASLNHLGNHLRRNRVGLLLADSTTLRKVRIRGQHICYTIHQDLTARTSGC